MSKLLSVAATKILHDEHLRNTITNGIQSIMKDGKIDSSDIPEIMLIIMECINNLGKFNLSYNQLVEVLEEVILFILEEQNVIPDGKKEDIYKMIRTSIKLVLLQPKFKSCLSGVWTKLKNILCCGKSDEQVARVVGEVKNVVENIVEQVTEPVVEQVTEPVVEQVTEPLVENIVEQVTESIVNEEVISEEHVNE